MSYCQRQGYLLLISDDFKDEMHGEPHVLINAEKGIWMSVDRVPLQQLKKLAISSFVSRSEQLGMNEESLDPEVQMIVRESRK